MTHRGQPARDANPFATRWIRPGAIAYQFPAGISAEQLVERLGQQCWRGQIVGSHGSGKTTLLHALIPPLQRAGRHVEHFTLHNGQRRLPVDAHRRSAWNSRTLVLVDGYEQLGRWHRFWLCWTCRRCGGGLLVTAHRGVGLPDLFQTAVTTESARRIVADLLPADSDIADLDIADSDIADSDIANSDIIAPDDVARCLSQHGGNLRETLLALYDLFEQRRR